MPKFQEFAAQLVGALNQRFVLEIDGLTENRKQFSEAARLGGKGFQNSVKQKRSDFWLGL
ncbi:MAG TPA: hypothetical protein VF313_03550 [Anaerolineaceae bacterium]